MLEARMKKIFIVAGEVSGDRIAGWYLAKRLAVEPCDIEGIGGNVAETLGTRARSADHRGFGIARLRDGHHQWLAGTGRHVSGTHQKTADRSRTCVEQGGKQGTSVRIRR